MIKVEIGREIHKLRRIFEENNITHKFIKLFDGYQITVDTLKGTLSFVEYYYGSDTIEAWILDSEEKTIPYLTAKNAYKYYTFCNIESKKIKAPSYPPKYCDTVNEMMNKIAMNKYVSADFYQEDAMRTCSIPNSKKEDMLRHAVFGLTSEAGEVAGILQKVYQGHDFDAEHMKKELGDCLWMIAEACTALDIKLSEVMEMNNDKLKARYPEGFDAEHSLHRAEGDI